MVDAVETMVERSIDAEGGPAMLEADPYSARQLWKVRVLEAEQRQRRRPVRRRRGLRLSERIAAAIRPARPLILDGSLELFRGLGVRSLRRLERHLIIVDLAPGDSLGRQGETASEFVVVLEGSVGVTLDGIPLTVLEPGTEFGALPLIDGGPGRFVRASFDVLEPTRVAIADRVQFETIMRTFPRLAERIHRIADQRRAYLAGHADAKALAADHDLNPFPVHLTV